MIIRPMMAVIHLPAGAALPLRRGIISVDEDGDDI